MGGLKVIKCEFFLTKILTLIVRSKADHVLLSAFMGSGKAKTKQYAAQESAHKTDATMKEFVQLKNF